MSIATEMEARRRSISGGEEEPDDDEVEEAVLASLLAGPLRPASKACPRVRRSVTRGGGPADSASAMKSLTARTIARSKSTSSVTNGSSGRASSYRRPRVPPLQSRYNQTRLLFACHERKAACSASSRARSGA